MNNQDELKKLRAENERLRKQNDQLRQRTLKDKMDKFEQHLDNAFMTGGWPKMRQVALIEFSKLLSEYLALDENLETQSQDLRAIQESFIPRKIQGRGVGIVVFGIDKEKEGDGLLRTWKLTINDSEYCETEFENSTNIIATSFLGLPTPDDFSGSFFDDYIKEYAPEINEGTMMSMFINLLTSGTDTKQAKRDWIEKLWSIVNQNPDYPLEDFEFKDKANKFIKRTLKKAEQIYSRHESITNNI